MKTPTLMILAALSAATVANAQTTAPMSSSTSSTTTVTSPTPQPPTSATTTTTTRDTTTTAMASPDGVTWDGGVWMKNGRAATKAEIKAHKQWMAANGMSTTDLPK